MQGKYPSSALIALVGTRANKPIHALRENLPTKMKVPRETNSNQTHISLIAVKFPKNVGHF
jgi:hypothetical protein